MPELSGGFVRIPITGWIDIQLDALPADDEEAYDVACNALFDGPVGVGLVNAEGKRVLPGMGDSEILDWQWETVRHVVQGNVCYADEAHFWVERD